MVKMNDRAIRALGEKASKAAEDAWAKGASKRPSASTSQRASDIAKEMKRAGIESNEREIRRRLDGAS